MKNSNPKSNVQPIKEGGKGWSQFEKWAGRKFFAKAGNGRPKPQCPIEQLTDNSPLGGK